MGKVANLETSKSEDMRLLIRVITFELNPTQGTANFTDREMTDISFSKSCGDKNQ